MSRIELRGIDVDAVETFKMPTVILMENAGRGAAKLLMDRIKTSYSPLPRVLILFGLGNNGGDGGVVARHLDLYGFEVKVVVFADRSQLQGDAAMQIEILERSGTNLSWWKDDDTPEHLNSLFESADWVVDGLLGTGLTRPIEGLLLKVVEAVNRTSKPILALDLPSGLDADKGIPLGTAVRATLTATFIAPKLGFQAPGAEGYTGEVVVIDIGVPRRLLEPFRVKEVATEG